MLVWRLREDNQNCCVLLCITVVHTDESSSYSSLDWVLSHWAHFTVHRFICVHSVFLFSTALCLHGGVDLMGLKPNP